MPIIFIYLFFIIAYSLSSSNNFATVNNCSNGAIVATPTDSSSSSTDSSSSHAKFLSEYHLCKNNEYLVFIFVYIVIGISVVSIIAVLTVLAVLTALCVVFIVRKRMQRSSASGRVRYTTVAAEDGGSEQPVSLPQYQYAALPYYTPQQQQSTAPVLLQSTAPPEEEQQQEEEGPMELASSKEAVAEKLRDETTRDDISEDSLILNVSDEQELLKS